MPAGWSSWKSLSPVPTGSTPRSETHRGTTSGSCRGPTCPWAETYVTDECDGPVHPGRHSSAKTLLEMDGDPVPRLFLDGPADVRFHRQLVGPISHGHE